MKKLRDAIKKLHGCDSKHLESVPIKEVFRGKTVWEGVVEVFELIGHPKAKRCYAWAHAAGIQDSETRCVAVLEVAPIDSPKKAVQAAIIAELKARQ